MRYQGIRVAVVLAGIGCGLLAVPAHAADWKPVRPINLIVPWAAGGSTDQVTRLVAGEMEKSLGQTIVIINQPGASGSIGTRSALEATKDGYTWTAGAAQDLGAYQTLGSLDTSITDWHLFLSVANVQVIACQCQVALSKREGIAGRHEGEAGQDLGCDRGRDLGRPQRDRIDRQGTGIKYRHVTYDGGNPAVVATVSGETDITTQLAVEEADMIRGKRLRPLATISDKALEIEGYGTIPPLSDTLPGFTAPANYFGIFIPKGVPDEVIATVEKIWKDNISSSEAVKKYATSRGALFAPLSGEAAQKAVFPAVQANAWLLFDTGKAKVSPDTVGIPKP